MGFWASSARVLYGASQLNQLPDWFMKVNKYGQPWISNLVVLFFSIFFCLFTGENWVQYIYAVSCIAAGAVYFMVCLDAYVLRKKHPEWERSYKVKNYKPVFIIGMLISIWIIIGSTFELPIGGYISLIIYFLIGAVLSYLMKVYRRNNPGKADPIILTPNDKESVEAI
jgi:APA family basic amino acid/polyamine antiporter